MPIAERWQRIINSYQEWIDAGHNIKPQLDLVEQIAKSKYAEEFYPCTSIATLIISNFENYADQIKNPSISVNFSENQSFKISFSENPSQTHKTEKFKCHQSQVFSLLESLFLRMKKHKNQFN